MGTKITYKLIFLVAVLFFINSCSIYDYKVESVKEVSLSEMSLEDKIAQMMIIEGKIENLEKVSKLSIGGIFLFSLANENEYVDLILRFKENSKYGLFVATDLEGCVNMLENIKSFKYFNEIKTAEEAYEIGVEMGRLMLRLGFNLNFAPVLDLQDTIWNCRSFLGSPEEIMKKGISFLNGLQSTGVMGTAKHFPGRTLNIGDTHKAEANALISDEDLIPFYEAIKSDSDIIMINHLIVTGSIDSGGIPSSVSPDVINNLRENGYDGFIVTDDLKMKAVSGRYENKYDVYVDAINAGNDLLLNVYEENPENAIRYIMNAVEDGRIDLKKIDSAVEKILKKKGINVIF